MAKLKDITNQFIGCYLVLHRVPNYNTNAKWRVKCIYCGNVKDIVGTSLRRNNSCRCRLNLRQFKGNHYKKLGKITVLFDSNKQAFKVSTSTLDKVLQKTWMVFKTSKGKEYVRSSKDNISLHRYLLNAPKDKVVDHINGNTRDNTLDNLRICTHTENMYNSKTYTSNTSGRKGVYKVGNKYRAKINVETREIHLGMYDTIEEAIKVREQAEIKYFKDFRNKE